MQTKMPHILVIDDNEDILLMLKAMLSFKGYQVSVLNEIPKAADTLETLSPDLLVMDMLLSGADGRVICKELKSNSNFASIPIIMISAHPDARKECLAAGANYFVEKPFDMQQLLQVVAGALN